MGIVGAVLVTIWAKGLITDTGKVLLDREMDYPVVCEIREVVEVDGGTKSTKDARVTNLLVWRVSDNVYSCALTVATDDTTVTLNVVRRKLSAHAEVVHAAIENRQCPDISTT